MIFAKLQPMPSSAMEIRSGARTWSNNGEHVAEISSEQGALVAFGETIEASWLVAGQVFCLESGVPASPARVAELARTVPQNVSRQFWGPYFIIVYDKLQNKFVVLADPCGQHPVFYRLAADGTLHVGNRIDDFAQLGGACREPDLSFLHQFLAHGYGESTGTGWRGVSHLPPGHALRWKRVAAPELFRAWSPWPSRKPRDQADFVDLLTMVHSSMLRGVDAITLELSGGLDSTALAVALQRAKLNTRTLAITHFDPTRTSSNEVAIARHVARHCGINHRAYPLLAKLPFTSIDAIPAVAQPATKLCFLARDQDMEKAGIPVERGILLNGHGGDSLYLAPPPFCVVVDAAASLHLMRAVSALRDLAIHYRLPLYSVLKFAFGGAFDHLGGSHAQQAQTVIQQAPRERPATLYDDVLRGATLRLRPARRYQIAALGAVLDDALVQPYPKGGRPVMPFLAQPIVEHAMQMNLEEAFSADHNRLSVRKAVYRVSGLVTLWRTDKGDIMHSALQGIKVNNAHVLETCLEGWAASAGLLDIVSLSKLIKRAALGYPAGLMEITRIYAVEMFVHGLRRNV
ncbi:asparagine synthase-related protein [Cupriavidus sp. AcVe19-1a]|uniref:asparagine synthase-related protein n=1 Tax=Cupriavidus sp. AcVe19-1a TaxID=2821359 RepID=UPI001AE943F8|nr:asparagine synthase-related protein [Cupriavidus sp. AcVe19-1a]MBP0630187.1 hypothetical protein [Cupriavidus sp. AcVe19-1a]